MVNQGEQANLETLDSGTGFVAMVAAVESAANRLPVCDAAAKMRGLVWRLKDEIARGAGLSQTIDRIATLARAGRECEPWMRLDRASMLLKSALSRSSEDSCR
jgi:hypothetical protein